MPRKRNDGSEPTFPPRPCAIAGCDQPGEYRAPKSAKELETYIWLCAAHIREYNARWNYFNDMTPDDVARFQVDAITGHRPTWRVGSHPIHTMETAEDVLKRFFDGPLAKKRAAPEVPPKIRESIRAMGMEWPFTDIDLKKRYKILVKQYHPDTNQGDKRAEEMFKRVTAAHSTVKKWMAERK